MRPSDYHEDEIVIGCQQGDRECQQLLYERFADSLMGVCMRYADDREEARDVLHNGFIKIFRNIKKFQVGTNLGGWLRRVMVNNCIDHYRKVSKGPTLVEINSAVHETDQHDVISEISAKEILVLVQKLSPAYKAVFNLYVIEGYSHREVGERLGISEGTSKSNLAKARAKLKKMLVQAGIVKRQKYA